MDYWIYWSDFPSSFFFLYLYLPFLSLPSFSFFSPLFYLFLFPTSLLFSSHLSFFISPSFFFISLSFFFISLSYSFSPILSSHSPRFFFFFKSKQEQDFSLWTVLTLDIYILTTFSYGRLRLFTDPLLSHTLKYWLLIIIWKHIAPPICPQNLNQRFLSTLRSYLFHIMWLRI